MRFIIILIFLFTTNSFSQITIDDVGNGWKKNVELSMKTIEMVDKEKYNLVLDNCKRIGFWNNNYSTTEGNDVILISKKDAEFGNINNLSAIIVHESKHLYYKKHNIFLTEEHEEILCYEFELNFLQKISNVETWLINHCYKMINHYHNLLYTKQ